MDIRKLQKLAVTALEDWQGRGRQSVWYMSRFHRINLFVEDGELRIRDWRYFSERYRERYLDEVCRSHGCVYDNPPLMDGYVWSTAALAAGIRVMTGGKGRLVSVEETSRTTLRLQWLAGDDRLVIDVGENALRLVFPVAGRLEFVYGRDALGETSFSLAPNGQLAYRHAGFDYALHCVAGRFEQSGDAIAVSSDRGIIELRCG